MTSKINLEALETLKLKYVTRLGPATLDQLLAQLSSDPSPELWARAMSLRAEPGASSAISNAARHALKRAKQNSNALPLSNA